jgi:TonB family protein
VALGVTLLVHGAMLWSFLGRRQGLEPRSWTMDMLLVSADGTPQSARQGGRVEAASGGAPAAGQEPAQDAAPETSGDGADSGQGGDAPSTSELARTAPPSTQAGEADGARDGLSGAASEGAAADNAYQRLLQRHIRPFRRYPAEAIPRRAEGVVVVRFRVGRTGNVEEAWVAERSRDPALDRAALETLWRAEPMPGVPSQFPAPVEVEVAMPFRLPGR